MSRNIFHPLYLVFFLGLSFPLQHCLGSKTGGVRCIERERRALLEFKEGVVDDYDILSSWGCGEDQKECCQWWGVKCNNKNGHVIRVDVNAYFGDRLSGEVSLSALLELYHLRYLDFSWNDFTKLRINSSSGHKRLNYLKMRGCRLTGEVPHQLGNLTSLYTLDLSDSSLLRIDNIEWLSQLRLLRKLDLSFIPINVTNWLQEIANLTFLDELGLNSCELGDAVPYTFPLPNSSFKSLSVLDLSDNSLNSPSAYNWSFNLPHLLLLDLSNNDMCEPINELLCRLPNSLESLYLGRNRLHGPLTCLARFASLIELFLGNNLLNGSLEENLFMVNTTPQEIASRNLSNGLKQPLDMKSFSSLMALDLGSNQFTGEIPLSIGQFPNLETLYLSSNNLNGTVSEFHFSRLSNLYILDLSENSLTFNLSSNWVPPFQLGAINLGNCRKLGPNFPGWLRSQNTLSSVNLSWTGLSEMIPFWFWDLSHSLDNLDLSHNQISGKLPKLSDHFNSSSLHIDLSFNNFSGSILSIPNQFHSLNLRNNMLDGPISFLCKTNNTSPFYLDLSNNLFSGHLPDCWMNLKNLIILDLSNNNFSGEIPKSFGYLRDLHTLKLSNNSFVGDLPSTVKYCSSLIVIDMEGNQLTGEIPSWIGTHLRGLVYLSIRSNKFHGNIPQDICQLSNIQVLDLSCNNISGQIPHCFYNFTYLVQKDVRSPEEEKEFTCFLHIYSIDCFDYMNSLVVQWKGKETRYANTLGLLKCIDLSSNKLSGEIPQEIGSLGGLISLNLSANHLTGSIIPHIDGMEMLESLDLSRNMLSGEIPLGLASLHFLSVLDLSHNNLSGKIPSSTQLQGFNHSTYSANPGLCGTPREDCPGDAIEPHHTRPENTEDNAEHEYLEKLYLLIGLGYFVGMLGVVCFMFKLSWRDAYFRLLENAGDWIYVTWNVGLVRLKRALHR